jgi:hypothetical protein
LNKEHENRFSELHPCLKAHASREENLKKIVDEGLKPMGECPVWPEELLDEWLKWHVADPASREKFKKTVLQCREEGVYFWDDVYESMGQGLVTVGQLKEGEPSVVIVNTQGLKLERDPEINHDLDVTSEPVAYLHRGRIEKERIECVCKLKEEVKPSTGQLMCKTKHREEECPPIDVEVLYEKFTNPENWECACKHSDLETFLKEKKE